MHDLPRPKSPLLQGPGPFSVERGVETWNNYRYVPSLGYQDDYQTRERLFIYHYSEVVIILPPAQARLAYALADLLNRERVIP